MMKTETGRQGHGYPEVTGHWPMMRYANIHQIEALREKIQVFADRAEGGVRLAELLGKQELNRPLVLAIPAGGVPVACALAERVHAELDVVVVSKITLPWNSEAGYGAVAFDGSYRLNRTLIAQVKLTAAQVEAGIRATRAKVTRRLLLFRQQRPLPLLAGRDLILVDDGLASGFTLQVAVAALRQAGAERLLVAVPTGHATAAERLATVVEDLYCANLRSGWSYAVAAAYRRWSDLSETEARLLLERHRIAAN